MFFLQVGKNASADDTPQHDWNGIANQPPERPELNGFVRLDEGVLLGKGLQQSGLSQRNRSILLGMTESTIPEAIALSRDGRGRIVPFHATVNGGIVLPCCSSA